MKCSSQFTVNQGQYYYEVKLLWGEAAPAEYTPLLSWMRATYALTDLSSRLWTFRTTALLQPQDFALPARPLALVSVHLKRGSRRFKIQAILGGSG